MAAPWEKYQQQGARTHDGLPARQNADGTYSTELSITVTDPRLNGGRPTNIPSLWGGRELNEDGAVEAALGSGRQWQSFRSIDEAVAAAKARSAAGGAGADSAGPWTRYQPQSREDRLAALVASNPGEYDQNSREFQQRNGPGGFGGVMRDIGRATVRAPLTVADTALTLGRSAVAAPVAGIAGAVTAPLGFISGMEGVGARNVERVQNFIAGQPLTEGGEAVTGAIAYPFEKLAQGADKAGDYVARKTGSPLLGTMLNTAIQGAPALLLRRGKGGRNSSDRVGPAVPEGEGAARPQVPAAAERPAGLAKVSGAAPSIDELQAAKNAAYKAAEETGVVVSRDAMNRLKVDLVNTLKKEGLDKDLHPAATAALKRITDTKGQPTLSELETLRKIANDARTSNNPADARLGSKIIERIDDFEETLGPQDVISGNASAATAFKEARSLNQRLAKAKTIQKLFDDAELAVGANYTAAGMDTALRQQFRALAKNDRKLRGFTPEEKAAIRKVVMGGPVQNAMRLLGKFAPNGVVSSLASIGAFGAAGPAGLALPTAGIIARQGAARAGLKNANRVSEMVRSGPNWTPSRTKQTVPHE